MERYIIPFDYQLRNYYVFISKFPGSKTFEITQLVPETTEKLDRQIPVDDVRAFTGAPSASGLTLQQTILRCLAAYLQQKGWPIDERSSQ